MDSARLERLGVPIPDRDGPIYPYALSLERTIDELAARLEEAQGRLENYEPSCEKCGEKFKVYGRLDQRHTCTRGNSIDVSWSPSGPAKEKLP